jgi:hypothetical protein
MQKAFNGCSCAGGRGPTLTAAAAAAAAAPATADEVMEDEDEDEEDEDDDEDEEEDDVADDEDEGGAWRRIERTSDTICDAAEEGGGREVRPLPWATRGRRYCLYSECSYLRRQVGIEAVGDQHGHGGVGQLRAHRRLKAVVLRLQVGHLEKGQGRRARRGSRGGEREKK